MLQFLTGFLTGITIEFIFFVVISFKLQEKNKNGDE